MYNLFWAKVSDFFKASFVFKWIFAFFSVISKAFRESVIYSFFTKKDMGDLADNSAIACKCNKAIFKSAFSEFVSQSFLVWIFSVMPFEIFSLPLRFISAYILPVGLILFVSGFGNTLYMVISAIVIAASLALLAVKTPLKTLLSASRLLNLFCDFFEINLTEEHTTVKEKRFIVFLALVGMLVGVSSFLLSFEIALIIFASLFLLPVLIASPLFLIVLTFACGVMFSSLPAFILCFLTFTVVASRIFKKMDSPPKMRTTGILIIIYLLIVTVYTFIGRAGSDSLLAGFTQMVLITAFFSAVTIVNTYGKMKKIIFSLSVFSIAPSALGIYQFLTGQGGTGWTNEEFIGGLARISSFFANPNVYGEYLIFTVAICISAILMSSAARSRIAFSVILILQLINLALTYSRGCYLAVVLIVLVVVFLCDKRLLSFGLVVLPILPYVLPQNMLTRITSIGTYAQDGSVAYRFAIWKGALEMFSERWFFGTGIGTAAFTSAYSSYMFGKTPAQHSHNTFLQIGIELGIVGLCVFILILIFSFRDVMNTNKKIDIKSRFLIIPLMACFIGIIFQSFFDHVFYNNVVFFVFWLVMGLLVASLNIVSDEKKSEVIK